MGVSLPGNKPSFWNVVFSSYLEYRTLDKAQKPSDSELICKVPLFSVRKKYTIVMSAEWLDEAWESNGGLLEVVSKHFGSVRSGNSLGG
jgi:hypothetical protein